MAGIGAGAAPQETPADFGTDPAAVARRWISELDLAEKATASWRQRSRRIVRKFLREGRNGAEVIETSSSRKFALLWSNIETLKPAVMARTPTAVVGRRWKDEDPTGRVASEVLERALNFSIDCLDLADVLNGARDDFLLVGRGQAWVRYVPHMQSVAAPTTGAPGDGQISDETYEAVAWEEAVVDHLDWDDFLHSPARQWAEVRWVARVAYLTQDELVARFGPELGKAIPLDHASDNDREGAGDTQFKKAAIYEIWDKPSRRAIWISKGYPERALDERDDPLGLKDFFPCPRPVLATIGPDTIIPTPDFDYYEGQARDIDELTARIGLLNDALRMRGFYAAGGESGKDLADLFNKETGTLIPVESWAAFAQNGGVKGLIEWVPIDMVASTIQACVAARAQLVNDVYQITGIADILRGDVDPDETATATRTKATWGSSRVRDRQKELARFARDLLRIMGQVIASKFSPETLAAMTNVQLLPSQQAKQALVQQLQLQAQQAQMMAQRAQQAGQQPPPPFAPPQAALTLLGQPAWEEVMGLLRDNTLRTFRIDIETDSTIEPNDQEEKQRRVEFVTAVGDYVQKSMPAVQLMPQLLPVIAEGLKFLVRGFRVGREMEETIDKALEQLTQAAGQGQPSSKGPDPQVEQTKAQAAATTAQARVMDAQTNAKRAQTDAFAAQAGAQIEGQRVALESQHQHLDRSADVAMHAADIRADLEQAITRGVQRGAVHEMLHTPPIVAPTR